MLLGHLLAATAAGWLLRRGDLALLRLAELSAHGVAELMIAKPGLPWGDDLSIADDVLRAVVGGMSQESVKSEPMRRVGR